MEHNRNKAYELRQVSALNNCYMGPFPLLFILVFEVNKTPTTHQVDRISNLEYQLSTAHKMMQ
jgi:hypothetical protein